MCALVGPGWQARCGSEERGSGWRAVAASHLKRRILAQVIGCAAGLLAVAPAGALSFTALADSPDPVAPGGELTFSMTLRGGLPTGDTGVVLQHTYPAGTVLSYLSDTFGPGGSSQCTEEASPPARVRCLLGDIAALANRSGTITFSVDAAADAGDFATIFRACTGAPADCASSGVTQTETTTVERADLEVSFTTQPAAAAPGTDIVYVVRVENVGDSTARASSLTFHPPNGFGEATLSGACAGTGPTCTLGDIQVGAANAKSITATFAMPPDYHLVTGTSPFTGTASAATESFDEDSANDGATSAAAEVTPQSRLTLALDPPSPNAAVPGEDLVYTVTLTNDGPSVAAAVSLDEAAPTGFPAPHFGGDCSGSSCSLGDVLVGVADEKSVTVTFAVPGDYHFAAFGNPDPIVYTASVAEPRPPDTDPPSSVYEDTVDDTAVTPEADLSVSAYTASQDPAVPGTAITYQVTVANDGPSSVDALTLTGAVPAGLLSPVLLPAEGAYNGSGAWIGLDLAEGGSVTLTIDGWVDPALDPDSGDGVTPAQLTGAVSVAPPAGVVDPDSSNDSATVGLDLQGRADLGITKTSPDDELAPPANTSYSIVVTNSGPSDVVRALITDLFDTSRLVEPIAWTCSGSSRATSMAAPASTASMAPARWWSRPTARASTPPAASTTRSRSSGARPPRARTSAGSPSLPSTATRRRRSRGCRVPPASG
jgi:large repetitive protein